MQTRKIFKLISEYRKFSWTSDIQDLLTLVNKFPEKFTLPSLITDEIIQKLHKNDQYVFLQLKKVGFDFLAINQYRQLIVRNNKKPGYYIADLDLTFNYCKSLEYFNQGLHNV